MPCRSWKRSQASARSCSLALPPTAPRDAPVSDSVTDSPWEGFCNIPELEVSLSYRAAHAARMARAETARNRATEEPTIDARLIAPQMAVSRDAIQSTFLTAPDPAVPLSGPPEPTAAAHDGEAKTGTAGHSLPDGGPLTGASEAQPPVSDPLPNNSSSSYSSTRKAFRLCKEGQRTRMIQDAFWKKCVEPPATSRERPETLPRTPAVASNGCREPPQGLSSKFFPQLSAPKGHSNAGSLGGERRRRSHRATRSRASEGSRGRASTANGRNLQKQLVFQNNSNRSKSCGERREGSMQRMLSSSSIPTKANSAPSGPDEEHKRKNP